MMRELFEEDGKGSPGPRDKKRRRPCRSVLAFGTLVAYLLSFSNNSRAQPEMYPSTYPPYPPDPRSEEQQRDPYKLPNSVDTSEALFSMYLDRSDEDDRKTTERWKGESDAILIFTGLFSAALAALLSISVQGLQQSPQDISAFYLGNIYHTLTDTTKPTASNPPKFSPPKYAVLVNALWFLSLVMSLTGALLAVFIQQWARSYLQATQGRHSPRHRARIRTYHAEGLDRWQLHQVTRMVPVLIHVSLFLFFSGLPLFLFNVNRTIFNVVVAWLALCVAGYACITLIPIFCQDSPYFSPLTSSIWFWFVNMLFIILRLLKVLFPRDSSIFHWYHTHYGKSHLRWPSLRAMQKAAARFSLQLSSDIDYRALLWMFRTLSDDDEFEAFFDALPSLCDSEALVDAQSAFIKPNEKILSHALVGMMDRTLLSDLVPEEVKQRRIIICTKAVDATSLLGPWWTLRRVLFGDWHGFSRSVHFGLFVQGWKSISNPVTAFYAQYVVAVTLASAQVRDDNWFQLASGQLNESKSLLWGYYAYGDSILLANAIFIIRRTIQTFSGSEGYHRIDIAEASRKTLELVCRFDIHNTLPEHQHQFCSLWNQLVDASQNSTHPHVTSLCKMILKSIRRLYITLHEDTPSSPTAFSFATDDEDRVLDDARSFPRCEMYEHEHSEPVPELQLGELPRNTNIASSIHMIPRMSPTLIPVPFPAFTSHPHPSVSRSRRTSAVSSSFHAGIPTPYDVRLTPPQSRRSHSFGGSSYYPHTSGPYYPPTPAPYYPPTPAPYHPPSPGLHYYPVTPSPYSSATPAPYSHSAPIAPLGVSPFVPIPQMTSSRARRRRRRRRRRQDVHTVMTETDSQQDQDSNAPHSPSVSPHRSSPPASHAHHVPEPGPHAWELPDVSSPIIHMPISTRARRITTSYIDMSHAIPGPTTPNRFERSSPPAMIIPETLPAPSLPTPASGKAAPVPPVTLSSPQERKSTPPSPPSVPQEQPVSQGTSIPVKPSRDTGPTRHVVSFDIPSPSTPSAAPLPFTSHGDPVATTSASSKTVPIPTQMTRGGAMSSAVGRGGHARSTPLATPPVIKFNAYGDFSGLLYYSLHSVLYEDELYPTALHLFEARKFLPHRPDLADRIRQCERVEEVASISAELAEFMRRDWYFVALSIMDEVLYLKFRQHSGLRTLLFNTYPSELVHIEPHDPFWGDGAGAGMNELGKSLMRVRERLRMEGGM